MPLQLLHLPQEIQDNIYNKYFEGSQIEVSYDAKKLLQRQTELGAGLNDRLLFHTKQDASIYLVCHKVRRDAKRACKAAQGQNLIIKNMGWTTEDLEALLSPHCYSRLHASVKHIRFEHFTCHGPDFWSRFLHKFHKVETLDLAIKTTSFGQTLMKPLFERVSNDTGHGEAQRFARYGAVSLAASLHQRYGEKYSIIAKSTCTWHLFGNGGSLRCVSTVSLNSVASD